jgi:hypothetical protein
MKLEKETWLKEIQKVLNDCPFEDMKGISLSDGRLYLYCSNTDKGIAVLDLPFNISLNIETDA